MTLEDAPAGPDPIWLTGAPDILDLVGSERAKLTAALASWLDELRLPMRFLICSRRERWCPSSTLVDPSGVVSELQGDLQEQLTDAIRQRPIFRRQVFVTIAGAADSTVADIPDLARQTFGQTWTRQESRPPALAEGPRRERPTFLKVGGHWIASLWLERLPGAEVEPGWLWSLVGVPGEFDLLLQLWPRSDHEADRSLRRRTLGLRARQLVAAERDEGSDPRLEAALSSTARLRTVLAQSQGKLFDLAMTVTVAADSPEGTRHLVRSMCSRLAGLRALLVPAWCDQGPARSQTELISDRASGPRQVVHSAEAASCWPWLDDWDGSVAGAVNLGRHVRTLAPVWLTLHGDSALPNANLGVVAASGSGKSYLAGLLGLEAVRLGVRTVVLDPENEHRRWCDAAGGQYLSLGETLPYSFNLLEMAEPGEAPSAVAELISLLCGPLSPTEIGQVADAVRWTLNQAESATVVLSDCLPRLRQSEVGEAVAHRLLPWLDGNAGALFNRPGRGPAVQSVAAIGLRELPDAWVPAATLLISHWFWNWVRSQDGRKQAIVDEAGLLADNAPLQRLMAQLARRIRKYQGSLVLLTQSAGDLLGSAPGEVMAVNSATMLLGSQHPAAALRLQRGFLLDDDQRQWLERAGRGQFLLLLGRRRSPIQIEAPPRYHSILAAATSP
ncbi:MAG: DUF87 domain-containing protein [Candidatus Dormiibacterota bacterium]